MLVDLTRAVGDYLHDVFIIRIDAWVATHASIRMMKTSCR